MRRPTSTKLAETVYIYALDALKRVLVLKTDYNILGYYLLPTNENNLFLFTSRDMALSSLNIEMTTTYFFEQKIPRYWSRK